MLPKWTAPGLAGRSGQPPWAATWNPPEGDRSAVRLRQTLHFSGLRPHTCHMVTRQRRCPQAGELGESADRGRELGLLRNRCRLTPLTPPMGGHHRPEGVSTVYTQDPAHHGTVQSPRSDSQACGPEPSPPRPPGFAPGGRGLSSALIPPSPLPPSPLRTVLPPSEGRILSPKARGLWSPKVPSWTGRIILA